MHTTKEMHNTNDIVRETGNYIGAGGIKIQLKQGERFPLSPVTNEETTWHHEDHAHKTGETVLESGPYVDENGHRAVLNKGDKFPRCPETRRYVMWKHDVS